MAAEHKLTMPLTDADIEKLRAGDKVLLSGKIYSARDSAHKKLMEALDRGEELPFDIKGAAIYYVGPTPPPPGRPIGSAGPTTSGRMDAYAPRLHSLGLKATIGKGKRNQAVKDAMCEYKAVYLGATGGVGALISQCITDSKTIAYEDLGTEAIREMTVQDMPLLVINDAFGGELFAKPKI